MRTNDKNKKPKDIHRKPMKTTQKTFRTTKKKQRRTNKLRKTKKAQNAKISTKTLSSQRWRARVQIPPPMAILKLDGQWFTISFKRARNWKTKGPRIKKNVPLHRLLSQWQFSNLVEHHPIFRWKSPKFKNKRAQYLQKQEFKIQKTRLEHSQIKKAQN